MRAIMDGVSIETWKRRLRPRPLIQQLEIRDVIARAVAFQERLGGLKKAIDLPQPGWYPWDSFGTLTLLDQMLTGRRRFLDPLIGSDPILDIGCGDGDLAFLWESLGYRVCAIDNRATNYNQMAGVEALKIALDSSVRIEPLDLDRPLDGALDRASGWPIGRCGLALFLGILYHLKNPYGVLESLAGCARYCLLSTAITRYAPDALNTPDGVALNTPKSTPVNEWPVAFLADRDGLRGDETNYWIFSETGLRTLVDRCGWEICDWRVVGDAGSVLWNTQRDERAICLLRSRAFDRERVTQLADGWHAIENGAWRWTARRFSMIVATGSWPGAGQRVNLKITVPESLAVPLVLTARVGGEPIATHTLAARGEYECAQMVPAGDEVLLEFELDRALMPDARDGRERGIVVRAIELG
jgi:tRNA (mo5U34)-methyltransferase